MLPYQLVFGKSDHLPVELEHKALWALKALNLNWGNASNRRGEFLMQPDWQVGKCKVFSVHCRPVRKTVRWFAVWFCEPDLAHLLVLPRGLTFWKFWRASFSSAVSSSYRRLGMK
ncbi:hypothetical protein MTR67_007256 [Solanum verrucosum]|uniref:Uncharacterized protein n=1 Tax=Solanum verrucosum TaxID=315347 RepID=A0AAF0Q4U2_SOLVR|nr:hypothetical protein MTR67_007256 [Solanum verrucosum]